MAWRSPHSSQNPNRRKKRAKRPKQVITWVDPQAEYGLSRRPKPARYVEPGKLARAVKVQYGLGALFVTTVGLAKYESPDALSPYLSRRWYTRSENSSLFPRGRS